MLSSSSCGDTKQGGAPLLAKWCIVKNGGGQKSLGERDQVGQSGVDDAFPHQPTA